MPADRCAARLSRRLVHCPTRHRAADASAVYASALFLRPNTAPSGFCYPPPWPSDSSFRPPSRRRSLVTTFSWRMTPSAPGLPGFDLAVPCRVPIGASIVIAIIAWPIFGDSRRSEMLRWPCRPRDGSKRGGYHAPARGHARSARPAGVLIRHVCDGPSNTLPHRPSRLVLDHGIRGWFLAGVIAGIATFASLRCSFPGIAEGTLVGRHLARARIQRAADSPRVLPLGAPTRRPPCHRRHGERR